METGAAGTGSPVNVQLMEKNFAGVSRDGNLLKLNGDIEEEMEEEEERG